MLKITLVLIAVLSSSFGYTEYRATAYCLKGKTASGRQASIGTSAADPKFLKLGTRVYIRAGSYTGHYVVRDTGGRIKGRRIDIFVGSRREALNFGYKRVTLRVL